MDPVLFSTKSFEGELAVVLLQMTTCKEIMLHHMQYSEESNLDRDIEEIKEILSKEKVTL